MNQLKSIIQTSNSSRILVKWALLAFIIVSSASCSKSGTTGSGSSGTGGSTTGGATTGGGNNPLLSKEVLVARNAANADIDSVVSLFQYDANKNLMQTQQTTVSQISGAIFTNAITYNFTYSNNLISGFTGTVNQTFTDAGQTFNSTSQVTTVFHSSGGRIGSYVQSVMTTGTAPLPVTLETGNDSATLTYDGSGNLTNLNIYQLPQGSSTYQQISQQTFTYNNGNMTQSVDVESVSGVVANTVTSTFQYDSKISATPIFVVPGVVLNSTNDLSGSTQTTTGVNAQTVTSSYMTTYNSTNQPTNSAVTLTITPANTENITAETITYTY
jgi:hypothetical protein